MYFGSWYWNRKETIMNNTMPYCPWDTPSVIYTKKSGADATSHRISILSRELFYLWVFIIHEELWNEARDFLDDYMDDPAPFEFDW